MLVGLLEQERPHHRGHSAQLARQARRWWAPHGHGPRESWPRSPSPPTCTIWASLRAPPHAGQQRRQRRVEGRGQARLPGADQALRDASTCRPQVNTILASSTRRMTARGPAARRARRSPWARASSPRWTASWTDQNPGNPYGRCSPRRRRWSTCARTRACSTIRWWRTSSAQLQSGELLRQRLRTRTGGRCSAPSRRGHSRGELECGAAAGLVVQALPRWRARWTRSARRDATCLVVGLRFGDRTDSVRQFRAGQPEVGGLPVIVLGEPRTRPAQRGC